MDLDYQEIFNSIQAIVPAGKAFEIRCLGTGKQSDSGYFNSPAEAASAVVSRGGYYQGIYITPNPVKPDIMARSFNRIEQYAKYTTHDHEVEDRRWLLIDVDAVRPTGISSSNAEHDAALKQAADIKSMLSMYGFPKPIYADSGNGAHLMYSMREGNTDEVRDEVQLFLRTLREIFKSNNTDVDISVFNAARIWRLYGTWARKGDSTPDRPHRRSKILELYDPFQGPLTISQLMRFNTQNAGRVPDFKPKQRQDGYPKDELLYRRLNEYAMHNMKEWVPYYFPDAREYKEGYRVASADIGQPYEEDLTIHPYPMGIKYFGIADQGDQTEGRRTPISIIAEYSIKEDKKSAALALSTHLNYPMTEFDALPLTPPVLQQPHGGGNGMQGLLGGSTGRKYSFDRIKNVSDLQKRTFKEPRWVIDKVLPAGNMLLAARPKMRKTWLAIQLSMAVAEGGDFLGYKCNKGDVLYLALEDNERRIRSRIQTLNKFRMDSPDLSGFRYYTGGVGYDGSGRERITDPEEAAATLATFPRGDACADAIDQFLTLHPKTTLVVIDTLAHARGERTSRDIYQSDYEAMMPFTKAFAKHEVCGILVTHEKKGNADRDMGGDFLEDVTGSAGMTGGADGVISIKGRRGRQEDNESRKIVISGRDVPFDYELDVAFDAELGGWKKSAREDVKVQIRALLQVHPFMNKQDIELMMPGGSGRARIYKALTDMKLDGIIEQGRFGYSLRPGK